MQFLVVATDSTDSDARARRLRTRPEHSALIAKLKDAGNFRVGGHTLDDDGNIIGSAVIVDFATRAELDAYLAMEPYAVQRVWDDIKVTRINLG